MRGARSVVLLALLLGGARAVAAPVDSARAEALIREANELRRKGEDQRALPLLQQAFEIARTARTAAQLGLAEMALGYWSGADEHLSEALAARLPWIETNRRKLEDACALARSHLVELTIDGAPAGAEVAVNGKRQGTLPLPAPVRVNEGRVDVEVTAPGHDRATRTLTLAGGAKQRLSFELTVTMVAPRSPASAAAPAPGIAPAQPAPEALVRSSPPVAAAGAPTSTWRRVLPWAFVGGAALGLAAGLWQHLAWRRAQGDFEAIHACGAGAPMHGADPRCAGLYDDLSGARTRALIGYGAATALGIAGAVLFATAPTSPPRVTLAGAGTVGLSVRLAF